MDLDLQATIAAIATTPGGSARGIVRIAGPETAAVVNGLFRSEAKSSLGDSQQSRIRRGEVFLKALDRLVPTNLFLWPDHRSYVGQPLAELHTLGSPPLLDALLDEVLRTGPRLAEPGEFTLRAFLSGRLDLTQAEAVLGVIEADDKVELNAALAQLAGGLSSRIHNLRDDLLDLVADLEAGLDFAEEEISFLAREELLERLNGAQSGIQVLQMQMTDRAWERPSQRVMLVGRANVGKSSLFNALVARFGVEPSYTSPALVSEQAGTTRDYLQATLAIGQAQFEIVDTAGARRAPDEVEANAQRLGAREQELTDLVLVCSEAGRALDQDERELLERYASSPHLRVLTKADLSRARLPTTAPVERFLSTSSVTGEGLDALMRRIEDHLQGQSRSVVTGTAVRCCESLTEAAQAIERALETANVDGREELVVLEVRLALEQLGRMIGAVYTDDILDRIFSRFCIGK